MQKSWRRGIAVFALFICGCLPILTVFAEGTRLVDVARSAKTCVLEFQLSQGRATSFLLACLRDVDMFTIASEGVADATE